MKGAIDNSKLKLAAIEATSHLGDLRALPPKFADSVASYFYYRQGIKHNVQEDALAGGGNWLPRQFIANGADGLKQFVADLAFIEGADNSIPDMLQSIRYYYGKEKSAGETVEAFFTDSIEFSAPSFVFGLPLLLRKPLLWVLGRRRFPLIDGLRQRMVSVLSDSTQNASAIKPPSKRSA